MFLLQSDGGSRLSKLQRTNKRSGLAADFAQATTCDLSVAASGTGLPHPSRRLMQIRCALVRSERSIPMLTVFVYDYEVIHLHHRLPTFTFERGVPNNTTSECQISVLRSSKSYYHCLHSWTWRKGGSVFRHGVCGSSRVSRRTIDHLC